MKAERSGKLETRKKLGIKENGDYKTQTTEVVLTATVGKTRSGWSHSKLGKKDRMLGTSPPKKCS